jgi:protein phosphatase
MSPCATSELPGWLERPEEAFGYFRAAGIESVICEEKHMGSRAVVVVCRDRESALSRFGIDDPVAGTCFTRTGRPFFSDGSMLEGLVDRLRQAIASGGIWEELGTDWLCLDCELMPWSVKARQLLDSQYAAVGAAGSAFCASARETAGAALEPAHLEPEARARLEVMHQRLTTRGDAIARYREAYAHYCWDVVGLDDLKLAPFHLLASEGRLHTDQPHSWHMQFAERLAASDPGLIQPTRWREVVLDDDAAAIEAARWWEELTAKGGEGMVVKPRHFVARGRRGLLQPAVKCRGREYLRIIYGPDYDTEENLVRLRNRGLGHKRSMAAREFALGLQALTDFVARRPLREVHQRVFAILAMESEPVDPRL